MSKKKTPILSNLFFLLKFIWKINKRIYALNIFKVVLDIAQSLTTVIFLRYIVQYIIIDKNWTLTAIFVGALVVSLGITQILSSVIEPILRKDMDLLEKQILTQVGMTAIKMDYFEMEKPFAKDLLQLAQDPGKFVGVLENVIVSISTFVTIIGLAATILAVDKILIVPLLVAICIVKNRAVKIYCSVNCLSSFHLFFLIPIRPHAGHIYSSVLRHLAYGVENIVVVTCAHARADHAEHGHEYKLRENHADNIGDDAENYVREHRHEYEPVLAHRLRADNK